MKKTWKKPVLEVLDVSETMKWHGNWPGRGGGGKGNENPEDLLLGS